eukprot:SAG31_NODE_3291_length_4457_cov_2.517439_1_plen_89_part_00
MVGETLYVYNFTSATTTAVNLATYLESTKFYIQMRRSSICPFVVCMCILFDVYMYTNVVCGFTGVVVNGKAVSRCFSNRCAAAGVSGV